MKNKTILAALMIMVGCASHELKRKNLSNNQRIVVTSSPIWTNKLTEGDDFVFSFLLPAGINWGSYYYENEQNLFKMGMASWSETGNPNSGADFSWSWVDAQNKQQLIDSKSPAAPWYTGVTAQPGRIAYVPNESDKVNWSRSGYYQTLWDGYLWVGHNKKYYCTNGAGVRNGETAYSLQQGYPSVSTYTYGYICHFRYIDGRVGLFRATTGWNLTAQELAANPNIVEERIAAFDKTLEPVWDTLEFNPMAYQFDLPK